VVVEGKIDLDKLGATLGAATESGPGRFNFSWAGRTMRLRCSKLQASKRWFRFPTPSMPRSAIPTATVGCCRRSRSGSLEGWRTNRSTVQWPTSCWRRLRVPQPR